MGVLLRIVAVLTGLGLLLGVSHLTILATGGYETPQAVVTMALAFAAGVGAACVGFAWKERRRWLAFFLALAVICGEAYSLFSTLERLVASREAAQAPLHELQAQHKQATAEVAALEAKRAALVSSPRLEAATEAKRAADAAVVAKSAERSCADNCRKLLQAQVDTAQREVNEARQALDASQRQLDAAVIAAKAQLAKIRLPQSASPLADRLGLSSWSYDLMYAGLGSIAANGIAFLLLAFGAHSGKQHTAKAEAQKAPQRSADVIEASVIEAPKPQAEAVAAVVQTIEAPEPSAKAKREHAARYCVERLQAADGAVTKLIEIYRDYGEWCEQMGFERLASSELGVTMADLFKRTTIRVADVDGHLAAVGIALKASRMIEAQPAAEITRMRTGGKGRSASQKASTASA